MSTKLKRRAAARAALGDAGMPSNLLAHHLRTPEDAGLVTRHRSEGDRRRSHVRLVSGALDVPRTEARIP